MKKPSIISNSSCLIALDNIGMIIILKELYGKIYITREVAQEVGIDFEKWVEIKSVKDQNCLKSLSNIVDFGEASTIALSLEFSLNTMILDDLKARRLAERLNLDFTGLLGVLLKAKKQGVIDSVHKIYACSVSNLSLTRLAGFPAIKEFSSKSSTSSYSNIDS